MTGLRPRHRVWVGICRLDSEPSGGELARFLTRLPPALHPEVTRYRRPVDRWLHLAARLLLGRVLVEAGLAEYSGLDAWRRDERGRPFLDGAEADLSLSHTRGLAACAVGRGCRVGLDVEELAPVEPADFTPYFCDQERELLRANPRPGEMAVRLWSRREAVLKADGRGLLAPESEVRRAGGDAWIGGVRWLLREVAVGERWCAYLALDCAGAKMELLELGCDALLQTAA